MHAIDMLEQDHRIVEELFDEIEDAADARVREQLFAELADALAVHMALEEQNFYPACRTDATEDTLLESLQEHLQAKRLLADLIDMDASDEGFMAKIDVLEEEIRAHIREEERVLFPLAKRLLGDEMLLAIGNTMIVRRVELESEGEACLQIAEETEEAPASQ